MSDTTTCTNCQATLPASAAFCTSCGTRLTPADTDLTTVDMPGLHDSTQVLPPAADPAPPAAPAAPWSPAPGAAPSAPATWGAPSQPAPPAWGEQPAAPPTPPPAPAWQDPAAAPAAPAPGAWGAPAQPPTAQQPWGTPAPGADQQWGPPAAAPATSAASQASPPGGAAALLGGVLAIVSLFLAWISAKGMPAGAEDSVSLWSLTGDDKLLQSKDGYLILVFGLVAIAGGVLRLTGKNGQIGRLLSIGAGAAVIITAVINWTSIVDFAEKNLSSSMELTTSIGFYLAIAGGVLAVVGGVLPNKKSS